MKSNLLSYFLKYKLSVDSIDLKDLEKNLLDMIDYSIRTSCVDSSEVIPERENEKELLQSYVEELSVILEKINNTFEDIKIDNESILRSKDKEYFTQSYRLYEESNSDSPNVLLDRHLLQKLIYRDSELNTFKNIIKNNSSWKYPGLFIRPYDNELVSEMASSDPLYIADHYMELLTPIKESWGEVFSNRVRYITINDYDKPIFRKLPKKQFGFICAYDFLNTKPLEVLREYLVEIFELLRPGGKFLFTFNNCNYPIAVRNFEQSQHQYTPETLLLPVIDYIGYEVLENFIEPATNVAWLLLKKPGELKSLRGGQALAKIEDKNAPKNRN